MSAMLSWALHYASRGLYVFPVHTPTGGLCSCGLPLGKGAGHCEAKRGRTSSWKEDATLDPEQIAQWWAQWPDANIGIATGRSGFFVVDLDVGENKNGPDRWSELLDLHGDEEGAPLEIRTGSGGTHLLYKHVDGVTNARGTLPNGIDIRGAGGYIVAPPSLHWSGARYEWKTTSNELAKPPAWLLSTLRARVLPEAPAAVLGGAHTLTRGDVEAFVTFKSKFADAAPLVRVGRAVLSGEPWAEPGSRHTSMVAFLGALRIFVATHNGATLDPDSSSVLFDACTAAVSEQGVNAPTDRHWVADLIRALSPTDAAYLGKLNAARAAKKAELPSVNTDQLMDGLPEVPDARTPEQKQAAQNDVEKAIQRAFGSDRVEPYTSEELAEMAPTEKRWVLITPAGYFLRAPGGGYIPVIEKAVLVKARDVLAPAYPAGVYLTELTDKGTTRLKSVAEVLNEHGQAPTNTAYSYCAERSVLDGDTFVQRTGTPKTCTPERNPQIEHWLELFSGEQHEALLDWLATLTQLNRPTAGLCIMGTSGAGKDLLVDGLAEIWGGARLSFERALHKFNNALIDSPLVVANEEVRTPKDFSGSASDALKEMITDTKRKVEAKYGGIVDLRGCLRVIIASNANGALSFSRSPTPSDIVALDERILLLRPSEECKTYLEGLGGIAATEAWVTGGGIARHVAWLQQTRVVKPGTRFLVQGRGGMSDLLSADGKGSAAVLRAMLDALLGPMNREPKIVQLRDGNIWASASRLKGAWATYGGKDELPEDFGGATENVFERGSGDTIKVAGECIKMRRVKWPVLLRAAEKASRLDELLELRGA